MVAGGMAATVVAIFVGFYLTSGLHGFMLFPLVVLLLVTLSGPMVTWRRFREVWHSISTFVPVPSHEFVPALEEAMARAGLRHARRPRQEGPRRRPSWDAVYDLDGLALHVMATQGGTALYLGPLDAGTRERVEQVKGVVEGAAAMSDVR